MLDIRDCSTCDNDSFDSDSDKSDNDGFVGDNIWTGSRGSSALPMSSSEILEVLRAESRDLQNQETKSRAIVLNDKQQDAVRAMASGASVFITGAAGSGKSEVIQAYTRMCTDRNIVKTATTGIAAMLINGVTLHSYTCIKLGQGSVKELLDTINQRKIGPVRWNSVDTLIIDEISMLSPDLFDKLEEIARIMRHNSLPFGGIQLILTGDFLQLPCVNSKKFCYEAESWSRCIKKTVYLNQVMRQDNTAFQECLRYIRVGDTRTSVREVLNTRIGKPLTNDHGILPTRLFCRNADVDRINNEELDKLAEAGREFRSYEIQFDWSDCSLHYRDIQSAIDNYRKNTQLQENLEICIGAQVMLLYNISPPDGLANGSRGVVVGFVDDKPVVKFISYKEPITVDFALFEFSTYGGIIKVTQVPLKVAYALTIHKSQGMTLDYVEVDLGDVFEYGQAYVALSRVRSLEGLSVKRIAYDAICAHPSAVAYYKQLEIC